MTAGLHCIIVVMVMLPNLVSDEVDAARAVGENGQGRSCLTFCDCHGDGC